MCAVQFSGKIGAVRTEFIKLHRLLRECIHHPFPIKHFRNKIIFRFAPSESQLVLRVRGVDLVLRSGTADLMVAEANLGDEFEELRGIGDSLKGQIIDAGAYIGSAAVRLRSLAPKASQLVAIEPSEANLPVLEANMKNVPGSRIFFGALATFDGEASLFSRQTGEIGNTIVDLRKGLKSPNNLKAVVPTISLKTLVQQGGPISILKLDVEGAEKSIFELSRDDLLEIPVILAELHDRIVPGCKKAFESIIAEGDTVLWSGEKVVLLRHNLMKDRDKG